MCWKVVTIKTRHGFGRGRENNAKTVVGGWKEKEKEKKGFKTSAGQI
jgi:hypothetical protein